MFSFKCFMNYVVEKPYLSLVGSGDTNYYQLGKNYTMECRVVGYPAPRLTWSFLQSDLMPDYNEGDYETIKVPYY